MLAIAGQTAGPNWLNFFEETHGYHWLKSIFFFKIRLFSKFVFFFKILFSYFPGKAEHFS